MTNLVRNITKEAKALVEAEICSLFLLDRENKELVAEGTFPFSYLTNPV